MDTIRGKYRGSLIGLAVGDALGSTLQFKPPGTFNPMSDICFYFGFGRSSLPVCIVLCNRNPYV